MTPEDAERWQTARNLADLGKQIRWNTGRIDWRVFDSGYVHPA